MIFPLYYIINGSALSRETSIPRISHVRVRAGNEDGFKRQSPANVRRQRLIRQIPIVSISEIQRCKLIPPSPGLSIKFDIKRHESGANARTREANEENPQSRLVSYLMKARPCAHGTGADRDGKGGEARENGQTQMERDTCPECT